MITELFIKDFALISELRMSWGPGLNIITGETGAGKSIILGALGLVLGSRATTDLIRSNCQRSLVEATFSLPDDIELQKKLADHGLEADDDGWLILRREINVAGKGRSFINARQVPVSLLKEVGRYLVDIHGQNEHQNILNISNHRKLLDRYANLKEDIEILSKLYKERENLKQKLHSVSLNEEDKNRRLAILAHEIKELEDADLDDERELDDLINSEKVLANAETILEKYRFCYSILSEDDDSLMTKLQQVERALDEAVKYDESLTVLQTAIRDAYYLMEDTASEISKRANTVEVNPEELNNIRERLDLLQSVAVKFGPTLGEAKQKLEKNLNEYQAIELSSEEALNIKTEIKNVEEQLTLIATKVSKIRREKAKELEEKVQEELADLGMSDTKLRISIKWQYGDDGSYSHPENPGKKYVIYPSGLDIVEILISSSANDTLRPLRKIASGGEMSRIMLALKKVIIDSDPVYTMIFDEVDAGVGGRIAEAVGSKLGELSDRAQLLVITHLHQIASITRPQTKHFKVKKNAEGTSIAMLNQKQRIEEVARMLAGKTISASALKHAEEILAN